MLQKHSHQVKKLLDLSSLNEPTWKRIQAAEVSIFMHAEDGCGDGLDESFEIIVNVHGDVLAYFEMTDGKAQVKTTTGEARDPDQLVKVYRGPRLVDAVEINESY